MDVQLYPGIPFSPQAALAENVGAADTIIRVTDVSAFPDAPNLATIGTDEDGETILYAAKTANALSGCVRGVEGSVRQWSAGEAIGRNFTAKDHNDLIAAVLGAYGAAASAVEAHDTDPEAHEDIREGLNNKQPTLAGQPGQVVGFSADGSAATVQGWSGTQLLDNAYWTIPECIINQRGVTGTITTPGYFIDRWKLVSGSVTITAGGLSLNGTMVQILETDPGQEVTASYLTDSGVLPAEYDSETKTFAITAEGTLIRAAKLELGSQQTLAYQDADGSLVLTDPLPNKALELLRCQRYYEDSGITLFVTNLNGELDVTIPWKVSKAIERPALSIYSIVGTPSNISYYAYPAWFDAAVDDVSLPSSGINSSGVRVRTVNLPANTQACFRVVTDSNL